jgi:hypothetical protein
MKTDELIQAMAADRERPWPLALVLPAAVLLAALAVAAVFLPLLGARPDLGAALTRLPVVVKQAFPPLLALAAGGAALRLARPGLSLGRWALALAAVPAVLLFSVLAELLVLPRAAWMPALMGQTNRQCLLLIGLMSLPLLAAVLWALRGGASTRPGWSGALAGLLSGSAATTVYAVHCTEDSPLFWAVWYVLAILGATALGALLGARLLRW